MSHWADIIAACRQYLLRWVIKGSTDGLSNEVHLSCDNHVADARDVIEHSANMFVLDAFLLDSCDQDVENLLDAAMEEDFKLVDKDLAHGPSFTSPVTEVCSLVLIRIVDTCSKVPDGGSPTWS